MRGVEVKLDRAFFPCPCKGCSDRSTECHATCRAYSDWKTAESQQKDPIRRMKLYEYEWKSLHYENVMKSIARAKK